MHTLPLPASQQMRGPDRGRRSPQPRGQDRRYPVAGQRYAGDRRRRSLSPGRGRSPVHYNNKRMRGPDGPYEQAYALFCPYSWGPCVPLQQHCERDQSDKRSPFLAGLGGMMTGTLKQRTMATILSNIDQFHQGMVQLLIFQVTIVLVPS